MCGHALHDARSLRFLAGTAFQVKRELDGRTLDRGIVRSSRSDPGGCADASAQDAFCANTICVIQRDYDQPGKAHDLLQAGPGAFKGPAEGLRAGSTHNRSPTWRRSRSARPRLTALHHSWYGFRNDNAIGTAINDEPEGIYYVPRNALRKWLLLELSQLIHQHHGPFAP